MNVSVVSRWKPASGVLSCDFEHATVILSLNTSRYHTISGSGTLAWQYLCVGESVGGAAELIARSAGVTPDDESVLTALCAFIDDLSKTGLIVPFEFSSQKPDAAGSKKRAPHSDGLNGADQRVRRPPSRVKCLGALAGFHLLLKFRSMRAAISCAYGRGESQQKASHCSDAWIEVLNSRIAWAGLIYPFQADCLERSLTALWFLRRAGIAAELRLGVAPYPFQSHAWVELEGRPVNDFKEFLTRFFPLPPIPRDCLRA